MLQDNKLESVQSAEANIDTNSAHLDWQKQINSLTLVAKWTIHLTKNTTGQWSANLRQNLQA